MIHVSLDANHRKGGTEVEIKKNGDERMEKEREEAGGRRWRWRRWARKDSYRGEEGKTVYIFVRDTPSPHIDSLSGRLFSRISSLNTVHTTRIHDANMQRICTRDANAGGRSARLV